MAGVHVLPGYASYFRNSVLEGNLSQVVVINNEPPNPIQLNIETLSRQRIFFHRNIDIWVRKIRKYRKNFVEKCYKEILGSRKSQICPK